MLTIDKLKELGADTENGIIRCANDEGFYLKMVNMSLQDANFDKLGESIEKGDLAAAFECAHALKGVMGNVGLTNLYEPIAEMTEELRERNDIDYSPALAVISSELAKLRAML